jgi:hypothetical protein
VGNSHGFLFSVATERFTAVEIPGAASVAATGLNDKDLISGFFVNKAGRTEGFLKPLSSNTATITAVPAAPRSCLPC